MSDKEGEKAPAGPQLARTRVGDWAARVAMILAGLGFVAGFFLPWLSFGRVASLSGFALLITEGEAVEVVSGPHRLMLLLVPLFGVVLCLGGFYGHRFASWVAAIAGGGVVVGGLVTLIVAFFDATGSGMWLVTASAIVSLGVGLLSMGRSAPSAR